MAFARIFVDGSSLLHQWMDLAPGKPRHSPVAREELINRLTQYHDVTGVHVTVVFDSAIESGDTDDSPPRRDVEIVYSSRGQTAAQLIEHLTHRFHVAGGVMVVSDGVKNAPPQQTNGTQRADCQQFMRMVGESLEDLEREIQSYNQHERSKFLHPH